jgi:hypothetical protein
MTTGFHLIKRNPKKNGVGHKRRRGTTWFVNTSINRPAAGSKAEEGDTLYVYETGYAVWALGQITEVRNREFRDIESILNFATSFGDEASSFSESKFWGPEILDKIWPKLRNERDLCVHVLEVSAELDLLDVPIFPRLEYVHGRVSWRYLPQALISYPAELLVSPRIPSALRYSLYQAFNLHGQQHYLDIDHFVPKSVGGPGNIEENLAPVGLSINRRMSDDIPSAVFSVAHRCGYLAEANIEAQLAMADNPVMLSDQRSKDQARKLIAFVNQRCLAEIRSFYKEVRKAHLPNFEFGEAVSARVTGSA